MLHGKVEKITKLSRHLKWSMATFFILVPAILILIHISLVPELKSSLVLQYGSPNLVTVFSSSFVHANDAHLYGNLLAYYIILALYFSLSPQLFLDKNLVFLLLFLFLLTPITTNLIDNHLLSETPLKTSQGFSGVVSAIVGLFPLVLLEKMKNLGWIEKYQWQHIVGLWIFGLYSVAIRYNLLLVAVLLGADAFFLRDFKVKIGRRPFKNHVIMWGSLLVYLLLSSNLYILSVQDGNLVNIFVHYVGFFCGLLTSIAFLYMNRT